MESRMVRRTAVSRLRATVGAVGGLLLLGVGGAAFADEAQQDGVDLDVTIEDQGPAGTLSLGVAADSETLTEVEGASPEYREFVGELPEVTVTDTRTDVPEGVYWYVTGQASDFVGADGRTRSPPTTWAGPRASSPTAAGRSLPARRCRPASMGARTRRPRTTS